MRNAYTRGAFAALAALVVLMLALPVSAAPRQQTPPSDATLSTLTVNEGTVNAPLQPTFTSDTTSYTVAVKHRSDQVTISATTTDTSAGVAYTDATGVALEDANADTAGRQIAVPVGKFKITVTVTAQDATTTEVYEIVVERDSPWPFSWTPSRDINTLKTVGNDAPQGIWSDATTMWVADDEDDKLYAYTLATRARDTTKEFSLHTDNGDPWGIWSDATTMWVSDNADGKLYAYTLATGARDTTKEFSLHADNGAPRGIWSNGTTVWVADDDDDINIVYAYALAGGARETAKEFSTRVDAYGIWSNGTTMWASMRFNTNRVVGELGITQIQAYTLDLDASGNPGSNHGAYDTTKTLRRPIPVEDALVTGISSDGNRSLWVVDADAVRLRSFNMVPSTAGGVALSALSIHNGTTNAGLRPSFNLALVNYRTSVSNAVSQVTVSTTAASGAVVTYMDANGEALEDANSMTTGLQVQVEEGTTAIHILVTASDGTALVYTVIVERDSSQLGGWTPSRDIYDLDTTAIDFPKSIWSDGTTMWITQLVTKTVFAYTLATSTRDTTKELSLHDDNGAPEGIWSDGTTVWVADSADNKLYAYVLSGGARDATKDVSLHAHNNDAKGIWSDGTTVWVTDNSSATHLFAYSLSGGARDTAKEFTLPANSSRPGIWSNGTTAWVSDAQANKLYAYTLSGGARDVARDIALSGYFPAGIWGNGTTMWVVDNGFVYASVPPVLHRVYSYQLPPASQGRLTLSALEVSPTPAVTSFSAELRPAFSFAAGSYRVALPNQTSRVTVSATASTSTTRVAYLDANGNALADADPVATGHQVDVAVGDTPIGIRLTAGGLARTYGLNLERDSVTQYGRTPSKDLNNLLQDNSALAGDAMRGLWADETTLYVVAHDLPKIFAYTRATGARDESKDITTNQGSIAQHYGFKTGIWSDGTTMWVLNYGFGDYSVIIPELELKDGSGKIFAYSLSDGARDITKEFRLFLTTEYAARGIWSDGTTVWVSDSTAAELRAYVLATGARDAAKDILLRPSNDWPTGIWSDGTTIWVAQFWSSRFYAYTLATGAHDPDKDFDRAPDNQHPRDIWSDGTTLFVPDEMGKKIFTYNIDDDPAVTVSFGAATYTVAEGGTATVTVTLSADPERTVAIPVTKTNQGGASAADYSGVPASVTFATGQTSKTITFTAAQDTVDDDGESVLLAFGTSLPTGVTAASPSETTVSIRDDDDPQVTVLFGAATYTAAEGGTATVTVTLSADPERTVEVPITTTNQGGASAADYSGVPASVTFDAGQTSKTITFTAAQDTVDDDGESVLLAFGSSLPTGVTAASPSETTVSIRDDDDPQVTVSFGAATYTAAEGGTATVTVTLSADPERTVAIPLTKTNQGGAVAADYSGVPASVTFDAGDTSQPITFAATQDTVDDDGESVLLAFGSSLPTGVTAASPSETTVSIRDDDDPQVTVSFGAATYTAAEGGTATVTVTLSADPERTVEVPITKTNQGGAVAADYSGVPATVTFNAENTSQPITFAATQDTVDDDGESVLLAFGTSLPTGVTAGATAATTVSITDDDDPQVTVSFGAATYTAAEGGTATVTVTLSADPERAVEVPITKTNQGGASAADYSGVPASVTFDAGQTSKTITFTAAQDTVDDDGESVLLAFGSSLPTGVTAASPSETTVSIRDDDDPAMTVSFGADNYTADEGGTASVTVTRSAAPERTVTIPITKTEQGGATSADYSGVPSSVTFNSGDMSKTIIFTAMADTEDDDGESVKIAFGTLPSGVSMGSPSETTVTIRQVSTEFILSCGLAVWCADMRFSDGTAVDWGWSRLRYEKDWDPPATVSDDTFTFRGVEYTLRRVDVHPGTHPIMPNAWSRTKQGYSYISLRITRGDYWDPPLSEHYRDWVLHLDGLELPFKDAFRAGDEFQWIGVAFQELFNDWISSTVTKIGIEEVAATAQEPTPAVPYTPIHVEAFAAGRNSLYVRWDPPWWRVGVPDATGYIVQWKEAADSWSDSAAVSQREVRGGWQGLQQLDGLTEGALYSVRVFATNAAGDGPPSEDTLGRPQPLNPRLDSMSVNGRTLTMRYDRQLDRTSVPASTAFVVLANGGLRTVDTVAVRGMEVVLTLAEGVSAANSVIARYEPPTDPAAAFLRDTGGNHVFTSKRDWLKEVANETPRSSLQPLTASFSNVLISRDGSGSFTFNIGFSEPVWIGTGFPRAHLLVVTGGTVTSAHWLERRTDEWAVTIRPDGSGDIVITLPKERYCVADLDDSIRQEDLVAGAPCAAGNRPLTNEPTATVTGTSSEQHDATENTPAEGAPRIDGDPAVGETLFAGTTGITDADGLNRAVFAYQWLADDTEMAGATGPTYTPTSADEGKTITVRVTFTDDAGNEESLTSAATAAVAAGLQLRSATLDGATLTLTYNETLDSSVTLPAIAFTVSVNGESRSVSAVSVSGSAVTLTLASEAAAGDTVTVDYVRPEGRHFIRDIRGRVAPSFSGRVVSNDTAPDQPEESEEQADPLTASAHGVPASHDGSAAFTFELRFSETPADGFSYKTLRDHAFTVTGGEVVKARRLERGKNVRWEITVRPDGDGTVTIVLPVTEDCASNHAICTEDGRPLSNRLQIAVPGPER